MKYFAFFCFVVIQFYGLSIAYASSSWTQVYKDKEVTISVDEGSYFDETGKVLLWVKNGTRDKWIYVRYQIMCKPNKVFRIVAINAQDKKTNKVIPIQLGDGMNELHQAPKKSPAEVIVNSVCGKK